MQVSGLIAQRGRVVTVGAEVTRLKPGDEVFGIAIGSFAEYAAAGQHKVSIKPASVSWEQAGVTAISGLTALQVLPCELAIMRGGGAPRCRPRA
jgi:NADPH:quinone reductase-like Zn-dependent oxidoreductase